MKIKNHPELNLGIEIEIGTAKTFLDSLRRYNPEILQQLVDKYPHRWHSYLHER